jgi:hypothetical protein
MSQYIHSLSDAAEVHAEEGAENQQLLVSQLLESGQTLNINVISFECGPWRWYRGVAEIHMNKKRVGEERGGKEINECPLTLPPLQRCGIMTHEDYQDVARSSLVKGIESKMATLIWHAALGYLQ